MRIIGCDLHARQQSLAMLETTTGEIVNLVLKHEGNEVREFYSQLPRPVLVGIEATGSMHWILKLLAENRFPAIWLPTKELLDLRALLLHRHQWVRIRTRIQNALQAIALANGLRRGPGLWSYDGQ